MAIEKLFHIGVKALITNSNGEILLLQINPAALKNNQHGVYWDIPGGRIQQGDTVENTLKREIYEETGLTNVDAITFFCAVISNIEIPTDQGLVGLALHVYRVNINSPETIQLSDEHQAFEWVTAAEAAERLKIKYPQEFTTLLKLLSPTP